MTSMARGPISSRSNARFPRPTPCSPVHVPSRASALLQRERNRTINTGIRENEFNGQEQGGDKGKRDVPGQSLSELMNSNDLILVIGVHDHYTMEVSISNMTRDRTSAEKESSIHYWSHTNVYSNIHKHCIL